MLPDLKKLIADVPDFPKPGIMFKDFTPLLADPQGLALAVELMAMIVPPYAAGARQARNMASQRPPWKVWP